MSQSSFNFIVAGGGTGGHLYPGIALAQALRQKREDSQVIFVGTSRGIEAKVLPREGFTLELVRVEGLLGKGMIKALGVLFHLPISLLDSFRILKKVKPDLVIGVGGYASGPLMLVATIMRKRRIILEQNVIPGMTNRILGPWVDRVVVSFEESRKHFHKTQVEVLGNPVRPELLRQREIAHPWEKEKTLLVFGGSHGARSINRAMVGALSLLKEKVKDLMIIHQTGESDFPWVKAAYEEKEIRGRVEPFLYDMGEAYGSADLVVSRAGATTVAELTACGLPSILIPFPFATHDHQRKNAGVLEKAGGAVVIEDQQLNGAVLAGKVVDLMVDTRRLEEMGAASKGLGHPQAVEEIADLCFSMLG